jgi:hypothetical protein
VTEVVKCLEDNHGGRQPLLAIDHQALLDLARAGLHLFQHDGPAEVGAAEAVAEDVFGKVANVFPQRLPLVSLVPNVRTLEQRNDETDVFLEQIAKT